MNLRVAVAAAMLVACGHAVVASERVQATLVLPDVRILPGVPFDFWVELHNRSDSMLRVSICDRFDVRFVSGEPVPQSKTRDDTEPRRELDWAGRGEVALRPGQATILAIPVSTAMTSSGFFRERLFSAPGRRFAISLPLCEQVVTPLGIRGAPAKLTTNEVELEIVSPTRSDALVWKLIEETSKREWTPADMALPDNRKTWKSVLRDFPDSSYVPYATLMSCGGYPPSDDDLARQIRAIRRFADSPVLEWLHVEAWETARWLRERGTMLAEGAIVRQLKRPTTRLLAER
jgi:hypothetical protein